jgi:uncharacterized membrane protein
MSDQSQNQAQQPFGIEETPGTGSVPPALPSENDKLLAGLSYISQFILPVILPAILLLSEDTKRNPFVRHHAVQSLALFFAAVVFEIVAVILNAVLFFLACILWVLFLLPVVPFIYYGILAFQGKYVEIPYLTKFLKQNKWL